MTHERPGRIRRLLADAIRSETRGDTLHRVRRRLRVSIGGWAGRPTAAGSGAGPRLPATQGADGRPAEWYVREWSQLAKAVLGRGAPGDVAPTEPAAIRSVLGQAIRQRAEAELAEAIARGMSLEGAVCSATVALGDTGEWLDWNAGWSLAEGAGRLPGGGVAAALGHTVLLHRRHQFRRGWSRVQGLEDRVLATYIPVEAVDSALAGGMDEGARERAVNISHASGTMREADLVDLAGRFLAFGFRDRAADLLAELRLRPGELDDRRSCARDLLEEYLAHRPTAVPAGAVPIAVLTHRTPDIAQAPGDVDDDIETLAMLGVLAGIGDVTLTGDDGLGTLAMELQERQRALGRQPGARGSMHLLAVDRDFSSATEVPDGTWLFATGSHMGSLYDLRHDFPYQPRIRPLFVSFHLDSLELLTEEGRDYLRRHGPIGCRDWTTVFLLLSAGIDAFFTGCVTTTTDALLPARDPTRRSGGAIGLIDVPRRHRVREGNARPYSWGADRNPRAPLADRLRTALDLLASGQRDVDRVVTGRLRTYLSLTSLGVPVEFVPDKLGDAKLPGLTGLRPGGRRLVEMRDGIRALVGAIVEQVLAGATEADVYAIWSRLTSEHVAEARTRFEAPLAETNTEIDLNAAIRSCRAGTRRFGPHHAVDAASVSDLVLAFDHNLTYPAAVLIESVVVNASGPLRLWVLGRGLSDAYEQWLADAFPDLPMTFIPCDGVSYEASGPKRRIPRRITVSTMDRLLLPLLLEDVDRVTYLDTDTLVLDDVCALAAIDLGGRPLAACDAAVSGASGWRAIQNIDEARAIELRRVMGARHGFGHQALNAGVLVLDLDRMRRDDFTRRYLGFGEHFGLHDQDTMLAYVGPDRITIDPRWNAMPVLADVADPKLIHWASFPKPWDPPLTYAQERWHQYAARLRQRAGLPPGVTGT